MSNNYLSPGAQDLYNETYTRLLEKTDRLFAFLFLFQWVLGIVFALLFSPLSWTGDASYLHFHVYVAVFLGGALAFYPAYQNLKHAGDPTNRYVTAFAQMAFSALYVHLTGGRIESHFHIFGSLAFLAFYRDPKVLILASIVTAIDHFVMGAVAPMSVYGTLTSTPWRAVEHSLWVLFEVGFLTASIREGLSEMKQLAQKQFELQRALSTVEKLAADRAAELVLSRETIVEQQKSLLQQESESVGLTTVQDIVERAISYRESRLQAARVQCSVDCPTSPLYVNGRASELVQAFVNLLDESIESTSKLDDKRALIQVTRMDSEIEVAFETNGPQVKSLEGLALAMGSVRAHSGSLSLDHSDAFMRLVIRLPNALEVNSSRAV